MKEIKRTTSKKPALKPNKTPTALGTLVALLRLLLKIYRVYSRVSWLLGDPVAPLAWLLVEVLQALCPVFDGA